MNRGRTEPTRFQRLFHSDDKAAETIAAETIAALNGRCKEGRGRECKGCPFDGSLFGCDDAGTVLDLLRQREA